MRKAFLAAAILVGSLAAGLISAAADEIVGDSGTQTVTNNTADNVSGNLILGNQSAGNGTYTITGAGASTSITFVVGGNGSDPSNPNGALIVGNAGTGEFTQGLADGSDSGNQVNVQGDLALGVQSGSVGTYTLNSGTLSVIGQVSIGGQSTGNNEFIQNGGTLNVTTPSTDQQDSDYVGVGSTLGGCASGPSCPYVGALSVGGGMGTGAYTNTGGSGSYTLTNDGIVNAYNVLIGGSGTGTMTQSGTSSVNTTYMTMGFNQGTSGTYTLNSGTVSAYAATVGNYGTGSLTIGDGIDAATFSTTTTLDVGAQQGGSGTVIQNANSIVNDDLIVGDAGTGTYTNTGGVQFVTGNAILGNQSTGNGTYTITDDPVSGDTGQLVVSFAGTPGDSPGETPNGALIVGNAGTGTFVQGTGTDSPSVTVAGDVVLGLQSGSAGTYTLNSGSLSLDGAMIIGSGSTNNNQFIQTGGTVTLTGAANGNSLYAPVSPGSVPATFPGALYVGGESVTDNGTGSYTLSNDASLQASSIYVGYSGTGTINQMDSSTVSTGYVDLGDCGGCNGSDSAGFYSVHDSATLTTSGLTVGDFGHGEFLQDGANSVVTVNGTLAIGNGATATPNVAGNYDRSGTYTLSNGALNTQYTYVGNAGTGAFIQSGGTQAITNTLIIGAQNSQPLSGPEGSGTPSNPVFGGPAPGTYTMTGGLLTANGDQSTGNDTSGAGIIVGDAGNGKFNQISGSVTSGISGTQNGDLVISAQAGSTGNYNLGDSTNGVPTLEVYGDTIIGRDAADSVSVPNPNSTTADPLPNIIVPLAAANGTLTIAGDGTAMSVNQYTGIIPQNGGNMVVGLDGSGTVNQSGQSSVYLDHDLVIGVNSDSASSEYSITATSTTANSGYNLLVGSDFNLGGFNPQTDIYGYDPQTTTGGSGTFIQNSGDILVVGSANVGSTGGSGEYLQFGGTLSVNNNLNLGVDGGTGNFYQYAGSTTVGTLPNDGNLAIGTQGANTTGTAGMGNYTIGSGYLTVNGNVIVGQDPNSTGVSQMVVGFNEETPTVVVQSQNGGGYLTVGGASNAYLYINSGSLTVQAITYAGGSSTGVGSITQSGGAFETNFLDIGNFADGGGSYLMNDGTLTVDSNLVLGSVYVPGSSGTFTQYGGQVAAGGVYLNDTSLYALHDGSLTAAGDIFVGDNAGNAAEFNQSGGTVSAGGLIVGNQAGIGGTYNLTAGGKTTVSGFTTVGAAGTAVFLNDNSEHDTATLVLGQSSGSNGTYTLQDGGVLKVTGTGFLDVGEHGTGKFDQTSGTTTIGGPLDLGRCGGAGCFGAGDTDTGVGSGTINLSGGSVQVGTFAVVGDQGTGVFNQSGNSTVVVANGLAIGRNAGGNGTYSLDGTAALTVTSGSLIIGAFDPTASGIVNFNTAGGDNASITFTDSGQSLVVGNDGIGTFNQGGGDLNLTAQGATLQIGANVGSIGKYIMTGGTLEDSLVVGDAGTGTFTNSGGSQTVTGNLTLGNQSTGNGTYNLSATGSLGVSGNEIVGASGTGKFDQTGGTNTAAGSLIIQQNSGSTGEYDLAGGTLSVANITNNGTLKYTGGTLGTVGTLANNGSIILGATQNIVVSTDYTNANFGSGNSFNKNAGLTTSGGQIEAAGNVGVSVTGTGGTVIAGGTTTTPTLALGNVRVGTTTNATFNVNNTGSTGPVLRGAIQNAGLTAPGLSLTAANFGPIALGGSQAETLTADALTAGSLSGQSFNVVTNFDNVQNQTVSVTGTAYRLATGSAATPDNLGNVRVGGTLAGNISVTNTAATDGFSEKLDASITGSTPQVSSTSGSVTGLVAGASNNSGLQVALNTAAAGAITGTATVQFQSDGTGIDGGAPVNNGSQVVNVSGNVYRLATGSAATPDNLGNVRVGGTLAGNISVTNTAATDGFSEKLDASITGSTPQVSSTSGSVTGLVAGASNNSGLQVALNTAAAGAITGTATVQFQSDGTGIDGGAPVNNGSQVVNVSGNVYRLATGSAATPDNLGNVRVGGTLAGNISVTNTAATDGFSEKLDASITGSTPQVSSTSGTVTGLVAGASNNSGLQVALNTAAAGAITGTATVQFQSDGTGIDGGAPVNNGSQVVNVSGNVYRLATGSAATPDNLGNVRVGGTLAGNISVTNTAATDGFSEKLDASITGSTPQVSSTSGSVTGLVAGASNNSGLQVALNTAAAGAITGTATVQFQSDGTGIDGGAPVNNGSQVVNVSGNVYNLASSSTIAPINLGVLHVGQGGGSYSQGISITNTAPTGAFSEGLDSSFGSYTNSGGSLSPTFAGSITNLTAGSTDSASMQVTLNTGTAGTVSGNIIIHQDSNGTIDGLANTALPDQNPSVSGSVTATITNLAVAQINNTEPINLGNVRVGTVVPTVGISVTNAAPSGSFTEGLIGNVTGATGVGITAGGGFGPPTANPELAGQQTDSTSIQVGLNTSVAGHQSGSAVIDFKSDGTAFMGGTVTDLGDTDVAATGNVFRLATGSATTPDSLGNVRIGGTLAGNIDVTNTASTDGFSENLDASITGSTPQVSSTGGTVTGLIAGASNNSGLQVALNTGTAGAISGTATVQFQSDGTGIDGGAAINNGSQVVNVTGNVYRLATGSATTPDSLGNVRVGGTLAGNIDVTNTASTDGFSENLDASITGSTPQVSSASGSVTGLIAGASNNSGLLVALNTGSAGAISGTATVQFQSDGTGIDGGAPVNSGSSQVVTVTGNVFRLATGSATTPDSLGNVRIGGTLAGNIDVTNTASTDGFSENLDASITGSTPQVSSASGSVTGLIAGASNNSGLLVALNTGTAGAISGTATVQFQSDGTGIDGGAPVNSGSPQVVTVTGNVFRLATGSATTPDSLGNVRIGGTLAGNIDVTNTASTDGFSENLDASITGSTPQVSSASGSVTGLIAGASNNSGLLVALNTGTAGAISGTATVQFQSDGTGIDGGAPVNSGSPQVVTVTGNVYRLATGSATSPDYIGATRVGGTLAGNISVTNTAATDGFSENLDASITGSSPQVSSASGSVTGLVAGASNNSGLQVALNTGSVGAISGTATVQFQSDGTGIDGGAAVNSGSPQVVTVTGKVYQEAVASAAPNPVNFGTIHVNQAGTQTLTVSNTASGGPFTDVITGGFSSVTGSFTGTGNLGGGVAGGSNSGTALQVGLEVGTAGSYTGTANLALNSHDADQADAALSTAGVALEAQVNNYASLYFSQTGGQGSLSGGGDAYTLNFGNLLLDADGGIAGAALEFLNCPTCNPAFTDLLSSSGIISNGSGFTLSGDSVSDLAGGASQGGFDIDLGTAGLGQFDETLTFDVGSSDADFNGQNGIVTLTLEGNIQSSISANVPEPPSLMIFGTAIFGLGVLAFRRRRKMAA